MRKYLLPVALVVAATAGARAAVEEGTVLEVTTDTIKIQQGGVKTLTFAVSNALLTNAIPSYPGGSRSAKFIEVKKGGKVQLDCVILDGRLVCIWIRLQPPDAAGIVTEVGKDTITILDSKEAKTTYRVAKDLVDNSRIDDRYSTNYPSRFWEVKPGCRVEVACFMEDGEIAITGIDVKKDK